MSIIAIGSSLHLVSLPRQSVSLLLPLDSPFMLPFQPCFRRVICTPALSSAAILLCASITLHEQAMKKKKSSFGIAKHDISLHSLPHMCGGAKGGSIGQQLFLSVSFLSRRERGNSHFLVSNSVLKNRVPTTRRFPFASLFNIQSHWNLTCRIAEAVYMPSVRDQTVSSTRSPEPRHKTDAPCAITVYTRCRDASVPLFSAKLHILTARCTFYFYFWLTTTTIYPFFFLCFASRCVALLIILQCNTMFFDPLLLLQCDLRVCVCVCTRMRSRHETLSTLDTTGLCILTHASLPWLSQATFTAAPSLQNSIENNHNSINLNKTVTQPTKQQKPRLKNRDLCKQNFLGTVTKTTM